MKFDIEAGDPAESVLDVLDAVAAYWDEANYEIVDDLIFADDDRLVDLDDDDQRPQP